MTDSDPTANSDRVWFITGSSTGFGRALAEEVLKHGDRVVATARDPEQVREFEQDYPGRGDVARTARTKQGGSRSGLGLPVEVK